MARTECAFCLPAHTPSGPLFAAAQRRPWAGTFGAGLCSRSRDDLRRVCGWPHLYPSIYPFVPGAANVGPALGPQDHALSCTYVGYGILPCVDGGGLAGLG